MVVDFALTQKGEPRSDLISRQGVVEAIDKHIDTFDAIDANYLNGLRAVMSLLNDLPSSQPERKKAKWEVKSFHEVFCNKCGFDFDIMTNDFLDKMYFCPHCGADMRGEEDAKRIIS